MRLDLRYVNGVTPSPACIALVKQFEGCRLYAYPDPATNGPPWTIGFGAVGKGINVGTRWTQEQADERLDDDLSLVGLAVTNLLHGHPTKQNEFDAFVSLAFNIGMGAFGSSTALRKHLAGDHNGAAAGILMFDKAKGRVMPGLLKRRQAEARLYKGLPV